jgi:hypothetical protein
MPISYLITTQKRVEEVRARYKKPKAAYASV